MSELTPNLGLFKYDPTTDGKEVFSIQTALNNNWDILDNLGSGKNIGEIVTSTIPLTDAGLHLLDGALLQSGSYADFVTYIAGLVSSNPSLFTTESAWQTSVTVYGVCGKFVYDSVNNTVRLPKITGITEGTTDVTALGDLVQAGLPNITGRNYMAGYGTTVGGKGVGALTREEVNLPYVVGSSTNASGSSSVYVPVFDASYSNSIYGNSATVQPQTIKVLYYIVIATSTKTDIQVDIDEIATDLNNKVDLDGTNATFPHIVETYIEGTSWYRVYSDGWCEQGGHTDAISVVYLKTFSNTNYNLQVSPHKNANAQVYWSDFGHSKTVSGFTLRVTDTSLDWCACGYIR